MITCGCGAKLDYEFYLVYESEQPHCRECLDYALESDVPVMVRKTNIVDYLKGGEAA